MFEKGPTVSNERKEKRHPRPLEPLSDPDGRYFITSNVQGDSPTIKFNRTGQQPFELGLWNEIPCGLARGGDFNLSRCIMKYIYRYSHFQFLVSWCLPSMPSLSLSLELSNWELLFLDNLY
ncbi:hypothetical protein V6N13_051065 [Hibiscus sabdariffa]|uniref:Uncharacterized protein n=1 Tax=Hibiscus sabdariffa TaxID=183260 RepID=A0ABR2T2J3_9ROSI